MLKYSAVVKCPKFVHGNLLRSAPIAMLAIFVASTAHAQWTVTRLHPAGATYSYGRGSGGGQQVGNAFFSGEFHAGLWSRTAASWIDLNPSPATQSVASGSDGEHQAGYAVLGSGGIHASLWSGTAASWIDLHPPAFSSSSATAVGDGQQAGYCTINGRFRASLWAGTAASWVSLHQAVWEDSIAYGVAQGQQVGYTRLPGGMNRAALWSGTATSYVDLNPAGASSSQASGVAVGQQVGWAAVGGSNRACLWTGSADSWVSLHPTGATSSFAYAADNGQQAGATVIGGSLHAGVWNGTAASWVDLHTFLPPGFTSSSALGISSDASRTYVVGYAFNQGEGGEEAFLWTGPAAPKYWLNRTPTGGAPSPSPRYAHAMAYDSARGVTVLFGGTNGSAANGETWEWDGAAGTWTQRLVAGPSPRRYHAMVFDDERNVTVLFSGYSTDVNGDTWEWNGTNWTNRPVSGPSPRYLPAMAYDTLYGECVVNGGLTNSGRARDTWYFEEGATWGVWSTGGPESRYGHAMAFHEATARLLLFGGIGASGNNGETWEWTRSRALWSQFPAAVSPTPRSQHAMVYDAARERTILFGGSTSAGYSGETWDWTGFDWQQRVIAGPSPRDAHAMAYDSARGVTVLFGGSNGTPNGETWELGFPPTIGNQASNRTLCPGGTPVFEISVTGSPVIAYQWHKNGVPIDPSFNPTAATRRLELTNATDADIGAYYCIATNSRGSATSEIASLFPQTCPADFNCDLGVDFFDYLDFVDRFSSQLPTADFNGDENIDFFDYLDFVDAFSIGCW